VTAREKKEEPMSTYGRTRYEATAEPRTGPYGAGSDARTYRNTDDRDWDDRREDQAEGWGDYLEDTAERNAIPLLLIGAGVAWMLLSNSRTGRQGYDQVRHWAEENSSLTRARMQQRYESARARGGSTLGRLREGARHLREQAGQYYDKAMHRNEAHSTGAYYDSVADYDARRDEAIYGGHPEMYAGHGPEGGSAKPGHADVTNRARGMARGARSRAWEANRSFWDMVDEHPLAAGLMGLALGAAIGATLPGTETEDEYMGEYRDSLMAQAMRQGRETADRAGTVAKEAARAGADAARERAAEEADRQNLSSTGRTEGRGEGESARKAG